MDNINKIFNIKLLRDSIYFKITFIIWALIHSLSFGAYITGYFSPIIIVWGSLILIRNILFDKGLIKKKYLYLFLIFLVLYCITIVYNIQYNVVGNIKTLIWTAIIFFAIFWNEGSKNKEKVFIDIKKISIVLSVCIFILAAIAIVMFCFDITYNMTRTDGKVIPQGFWAGRLWGIYVDPNQGATISIVALVSSLLLLVSKNNKSKIVNIFYVINIIVQYIFMVLTGSRGGEISFVFLLIGLIYLLGDFTLRNKINNIAIRRLFVFILSVIVSVFIINTFGTTRELLSKIPAKTIKSQNIMKEEFGFDTGYHHGNITMKRPDVVEGHDVSNGRLTLWKDGFRLIKYSPVLGFGDRNIFTQAKLLTPGSSLEKQYVHNGFIHLLLSGGIVAVITMLILLIMVATHIINVVFIKTVYTKKYFMFSFISLLIGSLLITALFLTELFYQNSFITTIFWIIMGFVVSIEKKDLIE